MLKKSKKKQQKTKTKSSNNANNRRFLIIKKIFNLFLGISLWIFFFSETHFWYVPQQIREETISTLFHKIIHVVIVKPNSLFFNAISISVYLHYAIY